MSWKISRQDYLDFFRAADSDQDGFISMKELRVMLREHGYKGSDSDINVSALLDAIRTFLIKNLSTNIRLGYSVR